MDIKTVGHFQQTLLQQRNVPEENEKVIRYNEKELEEFLRTLERIETKLDVLLMQRGK
ncbi:hypothetical protein [Lederbergia citrea]|uniref:hypothetical protein n=1 Tax=Lederbergia citrea TaxID=2833581 RepID=UPI001BC96CEE|nr:hypothetical protein [Lederbergia citrea]MBS4205056.1 hypothetical protein [Lederbergia citrea]